MIWRRGANSISSPMVRELAILIRIINQRHYQQAVAWACSKLRLLPSLQFAVPTTRVSKEAFFSNTIMLIPSSLWRQIIHARYECNEPGARVPDTVLLGHVRQCHWPLYRNRLGQVRRRRWNLHFYRRYCTHLFVVILNKQLGGAHCSLTYRSYIYKRTWSIQVFILFFLITLF